MHDRMPLMLPPERWDDWLAGGGDPARAAARRRRRPSSPAIEIRPVGPAVGNVRNNGPDLIAPVPVRRGDTLLRV